MHNAVSWQAILSGNKVALYQILLNYWQLYPALRYGLADNCSYPEEVGQRSRGLNRQAKIKTKNIY